MIQINPGVGACCVEILVAQEVGDFFDGSPRTLQSGRCGPTEYMRITEPIAQTTADKGTIHGVADSRNAQRFIEWSPVSNEQHPARGLRPSLL